MSGHICVTVHIYTEWRFHLNTDKSVPTVCGHRRHTRRNIHIRHSHICQMKRGSGYHRCNQALWSVILIGRGGRRTDLRLSKHSGWRGTANFIYLMNTNKGVPMVCEYHRHTPRTLVTHSNQGTHARDCQQACKRAATMSRVREKPASCGSFVSQRLVMDKACAQRAGALG